MKRSTLTPPRPVLIFAGSLPDARDFATKEALPVNGWVFVRDPSEVRYLDAESYYVLPNWRGNFAYDEQADLLDELRLTIPQYVPSTVHNR